MTEPKNLHALSAVEAARLIREGVISSEELVEACLARIRAVEPECRRGRSWIRTMRSGRRGRRTRGGSRAGRWGRCTACRSA